MLFVRARRSLPLVLAGVISSVAIAAAEPPKPVQAAGLRDALEHLTVARELLAGMVSDCNGGRILMRSCPGRRLPDRCDPVAPCSVVQALKQTEAAIAATRSAIK